MKKSNSMPPPTKPNRASRRYRHMDSTAASGNPGSSGTTSPIRPDSVRRRLLVPMLVVSVLVIAGYTTALYTVNKAYLTRSSESARSAAGRSLEEGLKQQSGNLRELAEAIALEPGLSAMLRSPDADRLYHAYADRLRQFAAYEITHFYFHDPGGTNLVRIHFPDRRGDLIERHTLKSARQFRTAASGLELGPLGTFTLRVVHPVLDGDELLGFVELLVAIRKTLLDQAMWESGRKMLDRKTAWDDFEERVVDYSSLRPIPDEAVNFLHRGAGGLTDSGITYLGGQRWGFLSTPLRDAAGDEVGELLVLSEVSVLNADFRGILALASLCAVALLGALFLFLSFALNRVDLKIARQDELQAQMQVQLAQQQKLEAIGTLAAGVAHEINNPINGIINYAQLIKDQLQDGDEIREFAEEIDRESNRIAKIASSLLTFARKDQGPRERYPLGPVIEDTLPLIRSALKKDGIELVLAVPSGLPPVRCNRQQIQRVLMNLLSNARDALNSRHPTQCPEKIIRISVHRTSLREQDALRLTVEDHGNGIDPAVADRLFDPFFTTKGPGMGTGLGLAISHGIARDHQGNLSVESRPGEFTRFHLDLPIHDEATAPPDEP